MKKTTTVIVVIAICMIIIGSSIGVGAYYLSGGNVGIIWSNGRLKPNVGNESAGNNIGTGQETFPTLRSIDISPDMGDIELIPQEGITEFTIEYTYPERYGKPKCEAINGNLVFRGASHDRQNGFQLFGFTNNTNYGDKLHVRLYFPKNTELDWATIDADLGDVSIQNLRVKGKLELQLDLGALDLKDSTADKLILDNDCGDTRIENITAKSVEYDGDLGSFTANNLTTKSFEVDADAGDIKLQNCDLGKVIMDADLGTIDGDNITTTDLQIDSSSGDVILRGALSGDSYISADLGAIELTLSLPRDSYRFDLVTDLGSVKMDGNKVSGEYTEGDSSRENSIQADCSAGSLLVNFK